MDLRDVALSADAARRTTERAAQIVANHQRKINERQKVKRLFKTLLGLDVADGDILQEDDEWRHHAGVVVDGHRLVLSPTESLRFQREYLTGFYVHTDGTWHYLGGEITDLESLGRGLAKPYWHYITGRDPEWVSGELKDYRPGVGFVLHWKDGRHVDEPIPVYGLEPIDPATGR